MGFLDQPISEILLQDTRRIFGSIKVQVILNENTSDVLTITKQPVQQGASITDHAFKEPTTLSMSMLFSTGGLIFGSGESLDETYTNLIELQNSRTPIDIITPKRFYQNMLISSIGNTTDKLTENCLAINITFQQIIIVETSVVTVTRSAQKNAAKTGKTENAGKKTMLKTVTDGAKRALGVST